MRNKLVLLGILFVAFVIRVYVLDAYPVSVSWDEAAIGYNAYSILQTGRDEYGTLFPVLFKSFTDYKLPGYVYAAAVSEWFFGLTPLGVRFPSALFGTLTVAAIFLLARELTGRLTEKRTYRFSSYVPYVSAFLLAISPWHIQFSRGGYESNGQLLFLTLGFYYLLRAVRIPGSYYYAAVLLGISFYFYYTTRVITPFLGMIYVFVYRKKVKENIRYVFVSFLIFVGIMIPLLPHLFGDSNTRASQVSILNDNGASLAYTEEHARNPDSLLSNFLYNRRFGHIHLFMENYARNNSFEYLFVNGDLYPRHDIFGMGVMYLWEWPFVVIGLTWLLWAKASHKWFFLAWLIIGALPASLTMGAPHALRTLSTLPVFVIMSAIGVWQTLEYIYERKRTYAKAFGSLMLIVCLLFFARYLFLYYDVSMRRYATEWGDGHRQLFAYLQSIEGSYQEIHVTGTYFKPYIHFLFHRQYSPAAYQAEGTEKHIGKYFFYPADWESPGNALEDVISSQMFIEGSLYVLPSEKEYLGLEPIRHITNSFGKEVFTVYATPHTAQ